MGTPQIPKTQQDALPLLTIAQAAAGDIQIVGNTMTKFWSSTVLGTFGNVSTGSQLYSPALDVRGMSRFALVVKRTFSVDTAVNIQPLVVYGFSDGTFPVGSDIFTGATNASFQSITNGSINIPTTLPNPLVVSWIWGDATLGLLAKSGFNTGTGMMIGTNVKICINNVVPTSANYSLVAELWGQS